MGDQQHSIDLLNSLRRTFASIRLTIVLLLTLAATSIIGTLIPQNQDAVAYLQTFGPFLFRLFSLLGLFDMYHSWWFQALLFLLTTNVVVCSLDRLSSVWKIVFVKEPQFNIARFRQLSRTEKFNDDRPPEQLKDHYAAVIGRAFRHRSIQETEQGFVIFAEKGRWSRLGVYLVHLSIVVLLVGGLISSIFGFEGFVNIPEGESRQQITLRNNGRELPLGFEIRCDDFDVSFYDSGQPKEYRSRLTILQQGKPVVQKDIVVNDPLRYKGVNLFQASYGKVPSNQVVLTFTDKTTGMIYQKKAVVGEPVKMPENSGTFVLQGYREMASFKGHAIGEAFYGTLTAPDGSSAEVILPLRFPSFDRMRRGAFVISISEFKSRYYTGLQVTKDPGVSIVYVGFIAIIMGCFITFFMSHQQLCVEVAKASHHSRIIVAGTANKNKLAMQQKVSRIAKKLAGTPPRA
jgi:cytochrome c biogenesis protein